MKVLSVFGTRPEAIKMAPVVKALEEAQDIDSYICLTAQHREMLDQVIDLFQLKVDYDLDLMKKNQSLSQLSSRMLSDVSNVLEELKPDLVLVHGDTATTMTVSLACFYSKIAIGHVEAGLRTGDLYSPWPEEANRRIAGLLAKYHFCPTSASQQNLLAEGIPLENTLITGNTVIDSLHMALELIDNSIGLSTSLSNQFSFVDDYKKAVLITGHRRENFGQGFVDICEAISNLAISEPNVCFIYPVHLNPNVQEPVNKYLAGIENIKLIEPLDYIPFVYLMNKSDVILTDSGGVQEEAPALGKPVLVMRNTTERPEGVEAGTVKLVGTCTTSIISETSALLNDQEAYNAMSMSHNPYGDGKSAIRIIDFIRSRF